MLNHLSLPILLDTRYSQGEWKTFLTKDTKTVFFVGLVLTHDLLYIKPE